MNEKQIIRFMKGFDRMCANFYSKNDRCPQECPLYDESGVEECNEIIFNRPETVVPIVLKWLKENPVRTRKVDFLEKCPKAPLNEKGYPKVCAKHCGYVPEEKFCRQPCAACWETDVEEDE